MKKNKWLWISIGSGFFILILLCGFLFYSLFTMKHSMDKLTKTMKKNQNELENQIANIGNDFAKALQEQNRFISSFEFIYGDLDTKTGKIQLTVKVVPKESGQNTNLLVTYEEVEGKTHTVPTVRKSDNWFEAKFKIPYNQDYHIGVLIKENNKTKQEYLDWVYNIQSQMQLQVTGAYLDGDYSYGDDGLKVGGTIHLDLYNPNDTNPIKGVEENYIKAVNAHLYVDGVDLLTIPMKQDENTSGGNEYVCDIDEKLEFIEGQQFELTVEIKDSLGFHYKTYALQGVAEPNGELNIDNYNYGYVEIKP